MAGYVWRILTIPATLPSLRRRLRALAPDVAVCAMPALLDMLMALALRGLKIPYFVIVHDADAHPGDGLPMQMALQRHLVRGAAGIVTLSDHVARRLAERGEIGARGLVGLYHPPFAFGPQPPPPRAHGGPVRLLFFGRLLPYKGLGLLAEALLLLPQDGAFDVRIVGQGPETPILQTLRDMANVSVDNRWVPDAEVGEWLAWSDAVVLSHTEASQSGVAAAAMTARRWLVATRVGGLVEQLSREPLARLCMPDPASLAAAIRSLVDDPLPVCAASENAALSWHDMAASLTAGIRRVLRR